MINNFEKIRDYGIHLKDDYFISNDDYIFNINFDTDVNIITLDDINKMKICKEYSGALDTILKKINKIEIFYPNELVPKFNIDNNELDSIKDIYTIQSKLMIKEDIGPYILALALCKKYNIEKIFDIDCMTGIQSWIFNQNRINYTGINNGSFKIFPFRRYKKFYLQYFMNKSFPDIYLEKNNEKLKNSIKNSLGIILYDIQYLFNDTIINDEIRKKYLNLLFRAHDYLLIKLNNYKPRMILRRDKTLKEFIKNKYIKEMILFEDEFKISCYAFFELAKKK